MRAALLVLLARPMLLATQDADLTEPSAFDFEDYRDVHAPAGDCSPTAGSDGAIVSCGRRDGEFLGYPAAVSRAD